MLKTFGDAVSGAARCGRRSRCARMSRCRSRKYTTLSRREIEEVATLKLAQVGLGRLRGLLSGGNQRRHEEAGRSRAGHRARPGDRVFRRSRRRGSDPVTSRKLTNSSCKSARRSARPSSIVVPRTGVDFRPGRTARSCSTARHQGIIAEGRPCELAEHSRDPRVTEFSRAVKINPRQNEPRRAPKRLTSDP